MYAFQHVHAAINKHDFATLRQSKKTLLALVVGAYLVVASPTYGATLGTTAGAPDPSSSFSATTGLFSSTSGAVSITSAGTEIIRVNGTGVGIGTTVPGTTLNVNGTITLGIAGGANDVGMYKNTQRQVTFDSSPTVGTGMTVNIGTSANQGSTLIVNGDVGIGTGLPDALVSLGGQAAQTIDMVRETTAATTGNDLTVKAGGATSGGTNLNGGNLNLSSGISTGTGTSGINFNVSEAGSSGTTDNSATTAMTLTGTGNVGIGTTLPGTTLNVNGTITLGIAGGANDVGMYKNTQRQVTFDSSPTVGTGMTVNIGTSANQGSTLIVNGDVGIGTTLPDALLSLGGQAAQVIDMVRETTASTAGNNLSVQAGGAVLSGTNLNGGTLNLASGTSTGTGTSGINFKVYEAGASGTTDNSATTAMVINGVGDVGIGTTGPLYSLDVRNSSEIGQIHVSGTGNDDGGYILGYSSSAIYMSGGGAYNGANWIAKDTAATMMGATSGGGLGFWADSGLTKGSAYTPTQRLAMNTSGSISIGTLTPRGGSTLDVNGKVYVATFATGSSTTVCQNANVLSSCTSALRFKEKVKPSELGLKEVLAMRPVVFDVKDHKDNWEKHDFGFVAEDMEKINPLFVTYDEDGRINGVRYMQLAAVNSKAIQELHALMAEQQEEINELKSVIVTLAHDK
jgi:hypothetical protein